MTMPAELDAVLAELRQRIDKLESERMILQLLYRYGPAIDYGDDAGWAECFTPDGIFEVVGSGAKSRFLRGRSELRAWVETHTSAPDAYHKHCIVDPLIEIDGDRATSTGYFMRIDNLEVGPVVQCFGRYVDELQREQDGSWKFVHRKAECEASQPSPFGPRSSLGVRGGP